MSSMEHVGFSKLTSLIVSHQSDCLPVFSSIISFSLLIFDLTMLSFILTTPNNSERSNMSPWEGVDTGALMMDDQCVAGDVECGLNALQMRGMRKELDEEPSEKIIGSVMTLQGV